ncbi:MAG: TRAM domain-containing protein [Thiotrichales bacterium]|nr:TRAM domain-containing protein [Thiotrichales bacterium]
MTQQVEFVEVTITSFDSLGRGVGHLADGTIVVVNGAKVGETVKAKVKFKTIIQGRKIIVADKV